MLFPLSIPIRRGSKAHFFKSCQKVFSTEKLNLWIEALSINLKRCEVCKKVGEFPYDTFAIFSQRIGFYFMVQRQELMLHPKYCSTNSTKWFLSSFFGGSTNIFVILILSGRSTTAF